MNRRRARLVWVRVLRLGLPLAAVGLALSVAVQVTLREYRIANARTPDVAEGAVRMVGPTFSGAGRDGRRYLVTARSGVRDPADPLLFRLDQPTVTVREKGDAASMRTVAKSGLFSQENLTLKLEGDVRSEQGGRTRMLANNAVIDTTTGAITGQGFQGSRMADNVRADSYSVSGSGDRVLLKGGVRGRLNVR